MIDIANKCVCLDVLKGLWKSSEKETTMSDALNYYLNFSLSFHLSSPLPDFNVAWLLTKCPLIAANIALGKK